MTESTTHPASLTPETVEVGMGVTWGVGSDRYAATVCRVSPSGKTFWFTDDESKMAPEGDYYGNQVYEYTTVEPVESVDPMGETTSNVKAARWNAKKQRFLYYGRAVSLGRHAYRDPSF